MRPPIDVPMRALSVLATLLCAPTASGQTNLVRDTVIVAGVTREYFVFAAKADTTRPSALLIVLHGGRGSARGAAERFGFNEVAGSAGAIVVYPEGLDHQWNDGRDYFRGADDVAFIQAMLAALQRRMRIDRRRLFVAGHSNGGIFANTLACRLPGVFAAIGTVGGEMAANDVPRCTAAHPISVVAIHGTLDPLVPYGGGGIHGEVIAATKSATFWRTVDGCAPEPTQTTIPRLAPTDTTRAMRMEFVGCRGGRGVVLYIIQGGGHGWPGRPDPLPESIVGPRSNAVDATALIWDFLAAHPAPGG